MGHNYPVVVRGEGAYLCDGEGRCYLDASGGPLVVNVGHGGGSFAQSIAEQAARLYRPHPGVSRLDAVYREQPILSA